MDDFSSFFVPFALAPRTEVRGFFFLIITFSPITIIRMRNTEQEKREKHERQFRHSQANLALTVGKDLCTTKCHLILNKLSFARDHS